MKEPDPGVEPLRLLQAAGRREEEYGTLARKRLAVVAVSGDEHVEPAVAVEIAVGDRERLPAGTALPQRVAVDVQGGLLHSSQELCGDAPAPRSGAVDRFVR